jgi:hypothetical protein
MVEGISDKFFSTRSAAERAYTTLLKEQAKAEQKKRRQANPPTTVSFILRADDRNRLREMAKHKGLSLSKLIRLIVEKEVQTYGEKE